MVYFTADLHLGHRNIPKYRPIFSSLQEHDNYMFSLLAPLNKRDILFILGDFIFDGDHYTSYMQRIASLPCQLRIILGNHDSLNLIDSRPPNVKLLNPLRSYKNMWLSHCPIHPKELRSRTANIHGHLHLETIPDHRYYNVNVDVSNYQLVTLDTIKAHYKE